MNFTGNTNLLNCIPFLNKKLYLYLWFVHDIRCRWSISFWRNTNKIKLNCIAFLWESAWILNLRNTKIILCRMNKNRSRTWNHLIWWIRNSGLCLVKIRHTLEFFIACSLRNRSLSVHIKTAFFWWNKTCRVINHWRTKHIVIQCRQVNSEGTRFSSPIWRIRRTSQRTTAKIIGRQICMKCISCKMVCIIHDWSRRFKLKPFKKLNLIFTHISVYTISRAGKFYIVCTRFNFGRNFPLSTEWSVLAYFYINEIAIPAVWLVDKNNCISFLRGEFSFPKSLVNSAERNSFTRLVQTSVCIEESSSDIIHGRFGRIRIPWRRISMPCPWIHRIVNVVCICFNFNINLASLYVFIARQRNSSKTIWICFSRSNLYYWGCSIQYFPIFTIAGIKTIDSHVSIFYRKSRGNICCKNNNLVISLSDSTCKVSYLKIKSVLILSEFFLFFSLPCCPPVKALKLSIKLNRSPVLAINFFKEIL